MIYVETPANPNNALFDIEMISQVAKEFEIENNKQVVTAVDNTYMGPIWQHPLEIGAVRLKSQTCHFQIQHNHRLYPTGLICFQEFLNLDY